MASGYDVSTSGCAGDSTLGADESFVELAGEIGQLAAYRVRIERLSRGGLDQLANEQSAMRAGASGAAVKNFTAAHATCVQNSIFAENCTSRAVPAPVMRPAVVLLMSMSPKSQFTVSNTLKTSARSSRL